MNAIELFCLLIGPQVQEELLAHRCGATKHLVRPKKGIF